MNHISALWVDRRLKRLPQSPPDELTKACQITVVGEGEPMWPLVRDSHPVCIVFDFDYPDAAGLQSLLEARQQFSQVPVLMLVEPCYASVLLWALRARVWDVLIKPVAVPRLLQSFSSLREAHAASNAIGSRNNVMPAPALPVESRFTAAPGATRPRTESVFAFVAQHLHEKLSEDELARRFGMSRYQFSRAFHEEHGVTFREHLLSTRLHRAVDMLVRTDAPITDIALCAGFQDLSHFARQFRRHTGRSPSEYRQHLQDPRPDGTARTKSTVLRKKR